MLSSFIMSAVLRIAAAIGLIFYLSPVRQAAERPLSLRESSGDTFSKLPVPFGATVEALWRALPNAAKQTLRERVLADSSETAPSRHAQAPPIAARDTLAAADLQPRWRGEGWDGGASDLLSREPPEARRPAPEAHGRGKRPGAEK
jgi:hypothetical protein